MDVFDVAERYKKDGNPVLILAGSNFGCGSAREWAAKGPWMLVSYFQHCLGQPV